MRGNVAKPSAEPAAYDESVFLNCPFTPDYAGLMRAYVFAVMYCGLRPRCARENDNGGEIRFDKLLRIIRTCRWSIHDLSFTQLDAASGLARFNMPFELGLFLAAQRYDRRQRDKECVIFEKTAHETKRCLSDISGQDPRVHDMSADLVVREVRDWLRTARGEILPGPDAVSERFSLFENDYPVICKALGLSPDAAAFVDLCEVVRGWIAENG
ncbi:hypothetical protein ABIE19_000877 [Brevundimonas faecalis]|uniref:Uncharacterized protein n=1 Tax=Brevundimonas faecalis TaxID=947378 RepID=A0ABV2R9H1_9CAUL